MIRRIFYLCIFVSFIFSSEILFKPTNFSVNSHIITNPHIFAIMVEFQEDSSVLTSGNGLFLDEIDIDMIWNESGLNRCENFLVDRPPHDSLYFLNQTKAVSNYFKSISNNGIEINSHIIMDSDNIKGRYKLSKKMEYYAISDKRLAYLFKESLELSKVDIESYLIEQNIDLSDVIFTVFHAGIGQDFSFPTFDPTVYDIKSAYIEESMFNDLEFPEINNQEIKSGILLPETQNMIFFDGIEDIFYGYESYCDFQLGMTGTFSFLMGYALGLPPLFNTETGKPGVGVFGLMDYGANNGRGVIPSIPSPWTRILNNWDQSINMTDSCSLNPLIFDLNSNNIYRFDISDNEYFLIENRSNKTQNNETLMDIVSDYNYEFSNDSLDYYSNWFDALNLEGDIFTSDASYVITEVSDYDLGLPGSGLLIWHINEPIDINSGINNNPNNKMIHIEEGDGALDIGFDSYALFSNDDPTNGTKWDFWYLDNDAYHYSNGDDQVCYNPENYEILNQYNYQFICEQNEGTWINRIIFDNFSKPTSDLSDGIDSFFSFEILDSISNSTRVMVKYESPISYFDINFDYNQIVGTSSQGIFFEINDSINFFNFNELEFFSEYVDGSIILTDSDNQSNLYQLPTNYGYLDPSENNQLIELESQIWFGYFLDNENFNRMELNSLTVNIDDNNFYLDYAILESSSVSLGDIDNDGLDEIVYVSDEGMIIAYNANGTLVNGFPMGSNYNGIVLIVKNSEDKINLICRKDSHIDIISMDTDIISLPSINHDSDIMLINNKITDGSRFYDFEISEDSYWLQRYNNHSHYPLSSGEHENYTYQPSNKKVQKFYNYPNPITNDKTKFRFFINDLTDLKIKIYNLSGYLVEEIKIDSQNLTKYEYNEKEWDCSGFLPGLYFAEIISDNGQEHLVKMVIGH